MWSKLDRGILRCAQDDKARRAARLGSSHPNPRQLLGPLPLGAVPAQCGRRQPRTLAGRGECRFPFLLLLLLLRLGLWFLIYDCGRGSPISTYTVTLLHDGLRDFIGQQVAIIPVPGFATFRSVAQITAFHQNRRINCFAYYAKIGRVHPAVDSSI